MVHWLGILDVLANGMGFSSQHSYGDSQLPIIPVSGDMIPSSGVLGHHNHVAHLTYM